RPATARSVCTRQVRGSGADSYGRDFTVRSTVNGMSTRDARQGRFILAVLLCLALPGAASARQVRGSTPGVGLFDAGLLYTSGVFVPLASYDAASIRPLATSAWTAAARPVHRVVADGVSLIVVRLLLPGTTAGTVTVELVSDEPGADLGSLWRID